MANYKISILFSALAFCLPSKAAADYVYQYQYIGPTDFNTPWIASESINNIIIENMNREFQNPESATDGVTVNTAPRHATSADIATKFSFQYSQQRTQQNLRNFVARTSNPEARSNLEQMFAAQPALMDDIAAGVRTYGFDPHNVADAYAVWWINIWGASQKRNIEPDPATVAAVKQQVYTAFATTPYLDKTSDAERQQDAEAFLVQAALLGSAFEQMKGDPKQLDQLAEAARQGAKAQGLDLSKMTLTSQGFVPRKGADASGAVDDDTIRSARTDTPAAQGETSGLALALAAGAGLGVTLLSGVALMRRG
jgi:hypothetical protein